MVLIFCLLLTGASCSTPIIVYHDIMDRETINDGEIWAGDLHVFFMERERIEKKIIRSRDVSKELNRILNQIKKAHSVTVFDDNYYEYAFIINFRDTLYTNNEFLYWKYKNLQMSKVKTSLEKLLE